MNQMITEQHKEQCSHGQLESALEIPRAGYLTPLAGLKQAPFGGLFSLFTLVMIFCHSLPPQRPGDPQCTHEYLTHLP